MPKGTQEVWYIKFISPNLFPSVPNALRECGGGEGGEAGKIRKGWDRTEDVSTKCQFKSAWLVFPGGTVDKNVPATAGDTGSIPGPGRFHMPRSN